MPSGKMANNPDGRDENIITFGNRPEIQDGVRVGKKTDIIDIFGW